MRVTVAGASGFVGTKFLESVPRDWKVHALSRSLIASKIDSAKTAEIKNYNSIEWRYADLFSLKSATEALRETDVAIYLVHSMVPSTRLFQGNFADSDLLIADNFANACLLNGVKQIIYLGGLVPEENISKHLKSRREVEDVFKSTNIPCTILRAGMVAGNGGSSFEILRNLVKNLPAMILPQWTQVGTQVIYIDDLIRVILAASLNENFMNQTIDVVNGEKLNYENLIRITCKAFHRSPFLLRVPIRSTAFSKLWVSFFGRTNYELVSPLIDSLLCELPQNSPVPLVAPLIKVHSFAQMLHLISLLPVGRRRKRRIEIRENSVRSIQRLPSLPNLNCSQIAERYQNWLPRAFFGFIQVSTDTTNHLVSFRIWGIRAPLLVLKPDLHDQGVIQRAKFFIVGGFLSKHSDCGWLEFRQVAGKRYTLAAIHEFVPTLPWYVYRFTQALLHKSVMNSFARTLQSESVNI